MKTISSIFLILALFLFSTTAWAESEIKIPAPKDPQAVYDRVWDTAIDTMFELGLPIAFMSKTDGYMVTDKEGLKEAWTYLSSYYINEKVRVTMRFVRTNDSINIKISSAQGEVYLLEKDAYWGKLKSFKFSESKKPFPELEKAIVDRISSKLKPVEGAK